jgi:tetratricopeptide (TPR) repeat protein
MALFGSNRKLRRNGALAGLFILAAALSVAGRGVHSPLVRTDVQRTVRIKILVDEEFRRQPLQFLETRKWTAEASRFFEKNFGVAFKIDEVRPWTSDNSQGTLSGLLRQLNQDMDRGQSDILLGFSGQLQSESSVSGVASYLFGCALVKKMKNEHWIQVTVIHELCHLFGAIDLEKEASVMNENDTQLKCDDFTREAVGLHIHRSFAPGTFPLPPKDWDAAMALYQARKNLNRRESGAPLMLAVFYLQMKDYEQATREIREAEEISPQEPAIQELLRSIQQQKKDN